MNLLNVTGVGHLLGVSKQRAHQLTNDAGFPKPVDPRPEAPRVWRQESVEKWAERNR